MDNIKKKYFLAANSCEGFVSYFNTAYDPYDGWRAYIIKGGPGTGKSTFMKKVALVAEEKGIEGHLCPCSSDPDSLDAVIFPQIKTVIIDGTSPHTVDPIYPAVVDEILNFGQFWDKTKLTDCNIIKITDKNKALHKTASKYLFAARHLLKDNCNTVMRAVDKAKVNCFAERLCGRYLKGKGSGAEEKIRFLTGVTPKGIVSFEETIFSYCDTPIIINDNYGCISSIIFKKIKDKALENEYKIITFKNALLPELIDHIVIPELELAFVRENEYFNVKADIRRIHSTRFIDKELLKARKIRYNSKTAKKLLNSAVETLGEAKTVHDELEKYYAKAMDFDALLEFQKAFSEELLK
ncbi:MAG: hypothetical protein IJO62_03655 [Clostridia bacterium]|nr:hypothetical protein [Clostridia bacterium]